MHSGMQSGVDASPINNEADLPQKLVSTIIAVSRMDFRHDMSKCKQGTEDAHRSVW